MNLIILIIIIVIILLIILTIATFYFYNVGVNRTKKEFLQNDDALDKTVHKDNMDSTLSWFDEVKSKNFKIESFDKLKLHGYFIRAKKSTKKIVIIVHGYSGNAFEMSSYAKFFHEDLNYNILLVDNRGHGKSEGNYIGFGWKDRLDLVKWINYMIDKMGETCEITLFGVSMGGATVLMTSGEDLPSNVKAIISDCAYTSAKDELSFQMKRMYKLPPFPLINTTSLLTKIKNGYSFKEASALNQVRKSKTPILFIHGDADAFVPLSMLYELYDNCKSEKELFIVKNAMHAKSHKEDKKNYENKIRDFLSKY